jgi:ankyrin repeat protein
MTKYFLDHGADPNAKSDYGETPLHLTVKKSLYGPDWRVTLDDWNDPRCRVENALDLVRLGDDIGYGEVVSKVDGMRNQIAEALVCHDKIDLDDKCYQGLGLLHCVPYKEFGSTDILSRLLEGNITIDARDPDGRTALHLACVEGNASAVSLLIKHGANILADDHIGRNSLHHAAQGADLETLQTILQAATRPGQHIFDSQDAQGWNAMHHLLSLFDRGPTTWHVELDTISCLTNNNVPVYALNNDGEPPIALYLKNSFVQSSEQAIIVDHLFSNGADASYLFPDDGRNLAHLAAARSGEIGIELLATFERHGIRLNAKDNHGRTILHHCARNGSLASTAAATFLCDHVGLSPIAPDGFGETPLSIANAEEARRRGHRSFDANRYHHTARLLAAQAHTRLNSSSCVLDKLLPSSDCPIGMQVEGGSDSAFLQSSVTSEDFVDVSRLAIPPDFQK